MHARGSIVLWPGRGLFVVLDAKGPRVQLGALEGQVDEMAAAWMVRAVPTPLPEHRAIAEKRLKRG